MSDQNEQPTTPAPAFPPPPEFTVGSSPVPAPPPAFPAPDPAFAPPDPTYTATPGYPAGTATPGYPAGPYPPDPAAPPYGTPVSAYPATAYPATAYPATAYPAPAYPAAGYPVPGQPAYGGYGGYGAVPGTYYAPQPKTNGLAIGAMSTAIVGAALLFCYGGGLPLGIIGAILGHVSRRQIRARGEGGDGMALAGIIIGWVVTGIGLVVVAGVIWFFAWLSTIPPTTGGGSDGFD
jgi:hypothetical protein